MKIKRNGRKSDLSEQRCEPSQRGCWWDKVTRLGSQSSAGNTLQAPETRAADLKFDKDETRNPVTDVQRERGEEICLDL